MITKPELDTMTDAEVVRRFREVSVEAADAIWAMQRKKPTDRDPHDINQDLYKLLPRFDAIIGHTGPADARAPGRALAPCRART